MAPAPTSSGTRISSRVPMVSAVIAVIVAVVAALIPVITSRSVAQERALADARSEVDGSADLGREQLRGWLADRTSEVECLASDPHFEQEVSTAIALVDPEDNEEVARAQAGQTEEEHAAEQARLQKAATEAKARVVDRITTFRKARDGCKRVLIAHKSSTIVISTENSDENGSLGGTLVSSALETPQPVAHVAESLEAQLGGPAVVAARSSKSNFVVIAAYEMAEIFEPLTKLGSALGKTGRVIVTDGRGMPLLGVPEKAANKALEIEPVTRAVKGQSGIVETSDEHDKLILAAYRPLPRGGLALIISQHLDDVQGEGGGVQWGALIGGVLAGLLGAVLIVFFGRKTLEGLGALEHAASRVAAGDLSERAPVTGDDDVSQIAKTFNDVVARLQKSGGAPAEPARPTPAPVAAPGGASAASDRTLASLRQRLVGAEDRHGVASGLLDVIWGHCQPAAVVVYVRDPASGAYAVLASRGMDPEKVQDLTSGQGAAGRCAASGTAVRNSDMPGDEQLRLAGPSRRAGLGQVALPITGGADVLGVLEVIGDAPKGDDPMLLLAADAAALALSRFQEQARASRLAEQAEKLLSERDGAE